MTGPGGAAQLERIFHALAHEQRREILLVLHFRGGVMTAGEIADRFGCSWPTTSQHLRVLVADGLITVSRQGRERHYRLSRQLLVDGVGAWLRWFAKPARARDAVDDADARG